MVGPLGCKVIMHKNTHALPSWDFRGQDGWNIGVSLEHYRRQLIVAKDTKAVQVSDTVELCHHCRIQPMLTHAGRILYRMNTLSFALKDAPTITCDAQLIVIT